jgi:hypothetical protein
VAGPLVQEHAHDAGPRTAALGEIEEDVPEPLDRREPVRERVVERPCDAAHRERRREVEDRSRERRDGNRVDRRAVTRGEGPRLDHDSIARLPLRGSQHGELDRSFVEARDAEQCRRRSAPGDGCRAEGQNGCEEPLSPRLGTPAIA